MSKMVDSDEMVLVRVKSASHPSCEDVEFTCDPKSTSVRQVKEKIRTLYSFHPDIADQRLIYAGHLLDDVQVLTDVFGLNGASSTFPSQSSYQHSGPYTIHLACTSKAYVSANQRNTSDNHQSDTSSQSPSYNSQIPNPMMQDPRLNGNMPGQSAPYDFNSGNGIPPEFFALHQLYVEQMSAYMRNWNMAYGMRDPNLFVGSGAPVNVPNFPNVNLQVNNPPPQPAPNLAPQNDRARPGGVGANFGGLGGIIGGPGGGNDDEENQRDLLDWAYTLSRLVLILSVVYFYSNFTRFLLVVIFTVAIAIFQRRPFQNQDAQNGANERQGNNNNNNNPVNPAGVPNRNEPRQNANDPGAGVQANDNAPNVGNPPTSPDGNGMAQAAENNVNAAAAGAGQHRFAYYRDVTWTFLTTFFTSLIPEMPQHN